MDTTPNEGAFTLDPSSVAVVAERLRDEAAVRASIVAIGAIDDRREP